MASPGAPMLSFVNSDSVYAGWWEPPALCSAAMNDRRQTNSAL